MRGPDFSFVQRWFVRNWLGVWFLVLSGIRLVHLAKHEQPGLFLDARLYLTAARDWLAGADPWATEIGGLYFAAPPPTLLAIAPLALLPEQVGVSVVVLLVAGGAVATVRLLRLPWWWLAFPPLLECVLSGNVQALLVPLLLINAGWVAALLKVYAAVPLLLLGRWRQLAVATGIVVVTAPFLPWQEFLGGYGAITARLAEQSNYSLPPELYVLALPLGLIALVVIGRERAAWMAVPALWPSPQPYYTTLALPTRDAMALAVIAFPIAGSGLLGLLLMAALSVRSWRSVEGRLSLSRREAPRFESGGH